MITAPQSIPNSPVFVYDQKQLIAETYQFNVTASASAQSPANQTIISGRGDGIALQILALSSTIGDFTTASTTRQISVSINAIQIIQNLPLALFGLFNPTRFMEFPIQVPEGAQIQVSYTAGPATLIPVFINVYHIPLYKFYNNK